MHFVSLLTGGWNYTLNMLILCCVNLVFLTATWFVSCSFIVFEVVSSSLYLIWVPLVLDSNFVQLGIIVFCITWIDTCRYNFIMDYSTMKLLVDHHKMDLVVLTAVWFVKFSSLYLSLFPPHFISSGFHLFSAAIWFTFILLCFVSQLDTWRYKFIMDH